MTNNNYQKHKERLRKEAREKYQNLSEEKKKQKAKKGSRKISNFYCRQKRKKSISIIVNVTKIFLRNKKRC